MGALSLVAKGGMTPRGKAVVSRNALKHGLRGAGAVVRGVEDPAEWKRHMAAVMADIAPLGYVEAELTRVLAEALWRRRRLVAAESAVLACNVAGAGQLDWPCEDAKACFEQALRRLELLNLVEHEIGDVPCIRDETPARPGAFTTADVQYALGTLLPSPLTPSEVSAFYATVKASWTTGAQHHGLVHPAAWPLARRILEADVEQERDRLLQAQQRSRRVGTAHLLPTESQAAILTRYEASLDRTISRCLTEIERLQRMSAGEIVPPPLEVAVSRES